MSDKITKFLQKLSRKEREKVLAAFTLVYTGDLSSLDVKSLTGKRDYFRIRVGRIRIIVERIDGIYEVVAVLNRDERTYKNL